MIKSELLALADRIEEAKEPSAIIDLDIWCILNGHRDYHGISPGMRDPVISYTSTLDDAMKLAPEGCWDHMEVYRPDHQTLGWTVHFLPNGNFNHLQSFEGFGPTFPIALCAASLRALAYASEGM